jgi:LuxR family maltose regulon positive regulatory protein
VETSLLTTKLNIPPARPQFVTRPHLTVRLEEGLNYNFILVSAPAGFGKTTLLSEWARQSQPSVCTTWLSLDGGDNDPTRFWSYFIAALQNIQPNCGEKILPLLHSTQPPLTEPILTVLINDMSIVPGDFVVVLDDYHFIESGQIHSGISYLIEHMPVQMHLVISSRSDPPLPLASYRGKGTMVAIDTNDLRFTVEDATSLLKELITPELTTEDVTALNERTEGWAVGLKMAALSMSGQKDIHGFIASFAGSQRYVMDYLLEEVLQKQTDELRDFLLKTSILERLSGSLCDAVTGYKGSQDILHKLERSHLFIVPLDESRKWYRYEHLFAELLRHQCETVYGTEHVASLHRQAGQWYEDNNLPDDAIYHVLACSDWEMARRLISEQAMKKIYNGEMFTVVSWTQRFPREVMFTHPEIIILYSTGLLYSGDLDTAESMLKILEKEDQSHENIQGIVAALQSGLAIRRQNYTISEELAKKALSLLPMDEATHRGAMKGNLGTICYHRGEYKEAEKNFTESFDILLEEENYFGASGALSGLTLILRQKGKLHQIMEKCQDYINMVGQSPAAATSHYRLSSIYYEWNKLNEAAYHIQQMIELSKFLGTYQLRNLIEDTLVQINLARICLARDDEAEFIKAVKRADYEARSIGFTPAIEAYHAAYNILFELRRDNLIDALKWESKLAENIDSLTYDLNYIPVRLLIAQRKRLEATDKLQVLYDSAVQSGMRGLMILYRLHQTLAAENEESALNFLADALTMAEPEGYIRTFVDEGKLLKPLLQKALSKGVTPEYTRKLLTIIEAEERQKRKMKKVEGAPSPYRALLSERELEVLQLMAEGLSNQQIADRLIISLSTAKNHVHNILEKLNVQGRTQAVAQARELEFI